MDHDPTSPAFQQLTKNNHGPAVVVASYLFLVLSIVVVITRLLTRFQVTKKFSSDDYLIIAATLVAVAQTIALTVASNNGLGRHWDALSDDAIEDFSKAYYASRMLAILSLTLTKSSSNVLIMGIKPPRPVKLTCQGLLIATNVWAVAAIFALAFECELPRPWAYETKCVNQWALFLSNSAWNIITDLVLVAIPAWMMQSVLVTTKKRMVVVGLFGSRIVVPIFVIPCIVATYAYYNGTPQDPTWDAVSAAIWNQAVVNLSIVTACVPCIKRFLADLSSGLIVVNVSEPLELTVKHGSSGANGSSNMNSNGQSLNNSRSYPNEKLEGTRVTTSQIAREDKMKSPTFRPTRSHNKSSVERSDSMKGLTDGVIVQTIDYEVYEHWRGSTADQRKNSGAGLSPTASAATSTIEPPIVEKD